MARESDITADIGVMVDFCDSRPPWQCGSSENANHPLRHYFPKGTTLNTDTPDHLGRAVEDQINNRPCDLLGDSPPA